MAIAISRPNTPRLLSLGLSGASCVFKSSSKFEELKQNNEVAISNISQETLKNVVRNMVTRVNICYAENGDHFQHLL
jgi:signal transduction histidine kinase